MKAGDSVRSTVFPNHTGVIIEIEQYGNTPLYVVKWDDKCPMTGRKGCSSTVPSEIEVVK